MTKRISEILDLPERVHKGDFVHSYSKGITDPLASALDDGVIGFKCFFK